LLEQSAVQVMSLFRLEPQHTVQMGPDKAGHGRLPLPPQDAHLSTFIINIFDLPIFCFKIASINKTDISSF
jgi:hypothetical protein